MLRVWVGRLINSKMLTGVVVSVVQNYGGLFLSTGYPGFTAVGMFGVICCFVVLYSYDAVFDVLLFAELCQCNLGGVARLVDG